MNLLMSYRAGLEEHLSLRESHQQLMELGKILDMDLDTVSGNEEFADDAKAALKSGFISLGGGVLSASKWVGGQALNLFTKGISSAGTQLMKVFENNEGLIRKIRSAASEPSYSFTLSVAQLGNLTSTGHWKDFEHDMDTLLHTLESTWKHSKDVQEYLNKQLICARKLKGVKANDAVLKVMDEFEAITYPKWNLPERNGNTMLLSDVLPEGKVFKCNYDADAGKVEYSMSGDKPAGESSDVELSKSEIGAILSKLDKINGLHKAMKQAYDSYLSFIKDWGSMVKTVDTALSETEGLSGHVVGEAEKLLGGDAKALAFYSGFCPRVVNYTDKYIHGVLGVLAKVI
ncbi:hypothetical protein AVA65_08190 [Salmonella enterica subsp. enterica serovar Minnesota]|nr:hypothetical protein [Salmonella enterica subsp. enterica serovar Minnesota]